MKEASSSERFASGPEEEEMDASKLESGLPDDDAAGHEKQVFPKLQNLFCCPITGRKACWLEHRGCCLLLPFA